MADYVTLYAETTELERNFVSAEQLFARLNTDPAIEFDTLEVDRVGGIEVLRFSQQSIDTGEEYARIRSELAVAPRPDFPNYYSTRRGIILLHPSDPKRYVTIGCKRNSYHGFIGSHFEAVSDDYFAQFIGENLGVPAADPVAITTEDPLPLPGERVYNP